MLIFLKGRDQSLKKKSTLIRFSHLSTNLMISLTFLGIILIGSLLLLLPVASRSGTSCGFMTALFTATSATCVTGLSLVDTYSQWSPFGQVVLLCLIEIGGLVMKFLTA